MSERTEEYKQREIKQEIDLLLQWTIDAEFIARRFKERICGEAKFEMHCLINEIKDIPGILDDKINEIEELEEEARELSFSENERGHLYASDKAARIGGIFSNRIDELKRDVL